MRRISPLQRFSVIVPVHVANRLGFISRYVAERLRRDLEHIADLAADSAPGSRRPPSDFGSAYVEAEGIRLYYQLDRTNRSVIARSIEEHPR